MRFDKPILGVVFPCLQGDTTLQAKKRDPAQSKGLAQSHLEIYNNFDLGHTYAVLVAMILFIDVSREGVKS